MEHFLERERLLNWSYHHDFCNVYAWSCIFYCEFPGELIMAEPLLLLSALQLSCVVFVLLEVVCTFSLDLHHGYYNVMIVFIIIVGHCHHKILHLHDNHHHYVPSPTHTFQPITLSLPPLAKGQSSHKCQITYSNVAYGDSLQQMKPHLADSQKYDYHVDIL